MAGPSDMDAPGLVPAFTLEVEFGATLDIGLQATGGRRSHVPIAGGWIAGARLRGKVVGGLGDLQLHRRSDGVSVVTLACALRTDDGRVLWISANGYRLDDARNEITMTLAFEAEEQSAYAPLARTVYVARNSPDHPGVFHVDEVL